jgi:hypothetical protein
LALLGQRLCRLDSTTAAPARRYRNLYFRDGAFYALVLAGERERFAPARVEVLGCSRTPERGALGSRDWVLPGHAAAVFAPAVLALDSEDAIRALVGVGASAAAGVHWALPACHDGRALSIHFNLGHAVLDELFPAWNGLRKFGLEDADFAVMLPDARADYSQNHEIFARFAGRPLEDLSEWPRGRWVRVETVLAGAGWTGLNAVSPTYQMSPPPLGPARDALRRFRDRMHLRHGLPASPRRRLSTDGRALDRPLRVLLVPNKRSYGVLSELARAAERACPGVEAEALDFREAFLWEDQLAAFGAADIYVSGIGTGFVGSFLLPDGAVAINLGHHMLCGDAADCAAVRALGYPPNGTVHYQDEHLSRSAGYTAVLHADPVAVRAGLRPGDVAALVCRAAGLIRGGFEMPVSPDANSSPLGAAAAAVLSEVPGLYAVKATGLNPRTGVHADECWARAEALLCDEGWFHRCGVDVPLGWHKAMRARFGLGPYCGPRP